MMLLGIDVSDSVFLSTPSARRATAVRCENLYDVFHFYPRPPRGGRHSGRLRW